MSERAWLKVCDQYCGECWAPPSDLPMWAWWEKNIELGNDSPIQGNYDTALTPQVRWVADAIQDPYCRKVTCMLSAQSAKTQIGINTLAYVVREAPGTAMWVAASKDSSEEFGQKRLFPALRRCGRTSDLLPPERNKQSKRLIQFDSMNLLMRGANSRIGLQSDPVRYIFCDERREWKPGRIEMLRKRTTTFHNSLELSMGTPGSMDDELHIDFEEGTQTLLHFTCPYCSHSQPFRFGRLATVLHRQPREIGGVVWEKNDVTRPKRGYNYEELRKTVRYQCENIRCGHLFHNADKYRLISSYHPHSNNPTPQRHTHSFNWNQLAMPWAQCDWAEVAIRFIKAIVQFRRGNQEPLIEVVTEDLGEPWDEPTFFPNEVATVTGPGYKITGEALERGKFWEPEITRFMAVDVQLDHFWGVCRAFAATGESRFVWAGRMDTWADIRQRQLALGVEDRLLIIDKKYRTDEVEEHCAFHGWLGAMGSDKRSFSHYQRASRKNILLPYSVLAFGKPFNFNRDGKMLTARPRWFTWAGPTVKTHLWRLQQGRGVYWGVPVDAPKHYVDQMNGERQKEAVNKKTGAKSMVWVEVGRGGCHSRDCECMILTAAIHSGLIQAGTFAEETAPTADIAPEVASPTPEDGEKLVPVAGS